MSVKARLLLEQDSDMRKLYHRSPWEKTGQRKQLRGHHNDPNLISDGGFRNEKGRGGSE